MIVDSDKMMIIEEQSGLKRKIVLNGTALPLDEATWETVHDVTIQFYQGNPEASAQPIGPKESPSKFHGKWDDYYLGSGQAVLLRDLFDNICFGGQLLKVTWGGIVRYGFLTKFSPTHKSLIEIKWEMEFSWTGRTMGDTPIISSPAEMNFGQEADNLKLKIAAIVAQLDKSPLGMKKYVESIDRNISKVQSAIQEYGDTVNEVIDEATMPIETASHALGTLGTIRSEAYNITLNAMDSAVAAKSLSKSVKDELDADTWTRSFVALFAEMDESCADEEQKVTSRVAIQTTQVIIGKNGDDLRLVSQRVYGTPNKWREIAEYNGLISSRVEGGKIIYLPRGQ
jgi:hypothetical protein